METKFTIGILRETQVDPDSRTPITPTGVLRLFNTHKSLAIIVQPSTVRAFKDKAYADVGCIISEDVRNCDLLMGVKEVAIDALMEGKKYLFFSHTAKKQSHNQLLLQTIINKNITLIDYEYLYVNKKNRIAAFGYFAGLAGMYSTLRASGIKTGQFALAPLAKVSDKNQMWDELKKVDAHQSKILITGNGRVSKGAEEILKACGIIKVNMDDFINKQFNFAVYYIADPLQYAKHKQGNSFTFKDYKTHPNNFESNFLRFAAVADIYVATHFWDIKSPKLFTLDDTKSKLFNIKVIGDITCDIDGSVPTTQKVSYIEAPYYDYNPQNNSSEIAFSHPDNIAIMAVDRLPSAIPIESSEYFSAQLVNHVLPYFWTGDSNKVLKKATIAKNGKIKKRFAHLRTFIKENK